MELVTKGNKGKLEAAQKNKLERKLEKVKSKKAGGGMLKYWLVLGIVMRKECEWTWKAKPAWETGKR